MWFRGTLLLLGAMALPASGTAQNHRRSSGNYTPRPNCRPSLTRPVHFKAVSVTLQPDSRSSVAAASGILYQMSGSTAVGHRRPHQWRAVHPVRRTGRPGAYHLGQGRTRHPRQSYKSARGPSADRRAKCLIRLTTTGSKLGAYSHRSDWATKWKAYMTYPAMIISSLDILLRRPDR